MSSKRENSTDDPDRERDASVPLLRTWWSELSVAAKVLVPMTAAVLVFVTANAMPAFIF
ncbi:hypothetical protein ACFFGH_20820 [Lysobacter korlensis]|uniref:Uncharacterized protein n=1 Tax=Lysobacter korlensis TaxID=553636 RepID=A0ABV6RTG7_9GAMM